MREEQEKGRFESESLFHYSEREIENSDIPDINVDRAIRLFKFLLETCKLRSVPIRTLNKYVEVLWLNDLPQTRGCSSAVWYMDEGKTPETWVEIQKPTLYPPPTIPALLENWLNTKEIRNSSLVYPELPEQISIETPAGQDENGNPISNMQTLELKDHADVEQEWNTYVENKWLPWAEKDRIQQQIQRIYSTLFTMYQQQKQLGETFEVILGFGYLTWKTPDNQTIERHLLSVQTTISFDAKRGRITLTSSAEGPKLTLEQDMVESEYRPNTAEIEVVNSIIDEIGDEIWDPAIHDVLKSWINAIPDSIVYSQSTQPQKDILQQPQVSFAPAIILRKRNERGMILALQNILDNILNSHSIPLGVNELIRDPEEISASSKQSEDNDDSQQVIRDNELYFPLDYNEEQESIAWQSEVNRGILVQGPPGTGKSHTIANLICHFLAKGKRILVTSQTARALAVLHDKIPESIKPLCVVALGGDTKSIGELNSSVQGIISEHNNWNPRDYRKKIDECKIELDELRREKAQILVDMREIREAETFKHSMMFGRYDGTLQQIAIRLQEETDPYQWISTVPEEAPALTNDESIELLNLLREFSVETIDELQKITITSEILATPQDFALLIAGERKVSIQYEADKDIRQRFEYMPLSAISAEKRQTIITTLKELYRAVQSLLQSSDKWISEAVSQILEGKAEVWHELRNSMSLHLGAIGNNSNELSKYTITGLDGRDRNAVKRHATELLHHLETGGKLGFGPFRPAPVKRGIYLIKEIKIAEQPCNSPNILRDLLKWINASEHFDALAELWQNRTTLMEGPFEIQIASYRQLLSQLDNCLTLITCLEEAKTVLIANTDLPTPVWHDISSISHFMETAQSVAVEKQLTELLASFREMERALSESRSEHQTIRDLVNSIRNRDEQAYIEYYQKIQSLIESRRRLNRRDELLQKLNTKAPIVASELQDTFSDTVWNDRLQHFSEAWNWSRANQWHKRISDPSRQKQLADRLDNCRQNAKDTIQNLAAAKAWNHCLSHLSEKERMGLRAYQLAVRRIRKGKGKYANQYRREARENMDTCRSAIPAWIMPTYRVVETMKMTPDIFDVIIVDEASQSGLESLFLQYLAKTIIVVGDDKQISPSSIGLDRQDVNRLREQYIPDIPYNDAFNVEASLFDQAQVRYKGYVFLKEHFRCMPEIIQFSNNNFYRESPLIPLKQYGAGRLQPTIKVMHIMDGYQQGRSPNIINPPEALALVKQIKNCCQDKAYDGKNMGVISLLGDNQAQEIMKKLMESIGPEEIEKRHLRCGDAYAFQGDERDVMFLSMVSAPGEDHRIGVLNRAEDERRFNVAASRAKEQMWLFNTITLNDLNPICLRYKLLNYCQNPTIEQENIGDISIDQLRSKAHNRNDRKQGNPPPPFDSWFEVDVFLKIHDKDYRVHPQFKVAGYRIDLLVEGMRGRLAVECDGDDWHGAEQWEKDQSRQRQIERSGYPFWRIRGGTYYRDPDHSLDDLWEELRLNGIYPKNDYSDKAQQNNKDANNSLPNLAIQTPEEDSAISDISDIELTTSNESSDEAIQPTSYVPSVPVINNQNRYPKTLDGLTNVSLLQPYISWTSSPLHYPREYNLQEVIEGLISIIEAEGPIVCSRLYHIYASAVGIQKVGRQIKSIFDYAIQHAIARGLIARNPELGNQDQLLEIVRLPGTELVILRERGNRTIEEIPPSEIIRLMQKLARISPQLVEDNPLRLFRKVLNMYCLKRMTESTLSVLQHHWDMYRKAISTQDTKESS